MWNELGIRASITHDYINSISEESTHRDGDGVDVSRFLFGRLHFGSINSVFEARACKLNPRICAGDKVEHVFRALDQRRTDPGVSKLFFADCRRLLR